MLVASVLSLKGGVGKTTVALGLASAAVHRGVTTVLIDLDPQANATATLDPEHDPSVPVGGGATTIADVLAEPRRSVVRSALRGTTWGSRLQLLAGSEDGEAHKHPDPGSKRLARLATTVGKLPGDPELVLAGMPIHSWPTPGAKQLAETFDMLLDRLLRAGRHQQPAARR